MFQNKTKTVIAALLCFALSDMYATRLTLPGTVISNGQKMIGARFMGYVKHVYVKLGQKVKREQDLYEMESAEFDILKSQADLMVEQAQTVLDFWRRRIHIINQKRARLKKRSKMQNIMGDLDDLEAQAENAQSMLEAAQVMIKQASIKAKQMASIYNYLKMKAPSDGVIVMKNIKEGDMVMPGMLTVMMVDTNDLAVDLSIPATTLKIVHTGQKVDVIIDALGFRTTGVVDAIIPDANPMTHKIKMRVTFDKKGANIYPGMYAKIIVDTENEIVSTPEDITSPKAEKREPDETLHPLRLD
jgi:membrane fusion protein (multidrug efflux system)